VARQSRRTAGTSTGEVILWLLFFALLVPAGFAGWAVGHYTAGGTQTVIRTVAARPATTTAAPATTAAATTAPTTTAPATTAPATTAPQTAKTATTTTAATTTAPAAANAAQGKPVFAANGCGSCHTFKPAGSTGTIGPDLDTTPAKDATKDNMPLAAFIRESIVDPNAYISPGYQKGVMPESFGTSLSKIQLAQLVAFVAAGSK
jgi:cytochrome c551/c552